MRRWNGWGDESVIYDLPNNARFFLETAVGSSSQTVDATLKTIVTKVPQSRLPDHMLINKDPEDRARHSVGQSLPDWIAMRSGSIPAFPDGVAHPKNHEDVNAILRLAKDMDALIIPYGGGTSVVGHLSAPVGLRPVITVDLGEMNQMLACDRKEGLATFQAGVRGPDLETALGQHGLTLGHYPQSFEYSTLGGWIAARSAGQLSRGYGRMEQLFAGGDVETPQGQLHIPALPASAAGPDIRELLLGSEGRLGIITNGVVRISAAPESQAYHAAFFRTEDAGVACVRQLAQSGVPLAMMRLSLPVETETMLTLSGDHLTLRLLNRYLSVRGARDEKCMLLFGAVGTKRQVRFAIGQAIACIKDHGGIHVGTAPGKSWYANRFHVPYLRNTLWELGYAIDTLETATTWSKVPDTVRGIENALRFGLQTSQEKVHVFTHLSHIYPHGSSIYTTYIFRLAADPEESLFRWRKLKTAASQVIVQAGGTISHQHGVGTDHAPYLAAEKGEFGLEVLRALIQTCDPDNRMNPGKLLP